MIIELLGPGGVGKTTVEPMVADRLGIAYYPGKKRHDLVGRPQSSVEVWTTRLWSVLSRPSLAIAALRVHQGSASDRWRFAFDICRRERRGGKGASSWEWRVGEWPGTCAVHDVWRQRRRREGDHPPLDPGRRLRAAACRTCRSHPSLGRSPRPTADRTSGRMRAGCPCTRVLQAVSPSPWSAPCSMCVPMAPQAEVAEALAERIRRLE